MKAMKELPVLAVLAAFAVSGSVMAQGSATSDTHAAHHAGDAKSPQDAYAEGEVRKIDKEAGKITLRHGPIANLDMPPMSMVFRAKDAAMLDQVKPGDKVRFKAEKVDGALTVTELQPAK